MDQSGFEVLGFIEVPLGLSGPVLLWTLSERTCPDAKVMKASDVLLRKRHCCRLVIFPLS